MPTMNFAAVSGEWNTAGNWNLSTDAGVHRVPLSTDDTTFTGLDGSGALTITTTTAVAKSVDFSTAGAAFTLSGNGAFYVYGNLSFAANMTVTNTGQWRWIGNGVYDTQGISLSTISSLYTIGSTITLGSNLNLGSKSYYIYNSSSLITQNYNITCGIWADATQSGALTLTLGSSTINCSNVLFEVATLTVTANTATINVTSTVDVTSNLGGVNWNGTSFVYIMTGGKILTLNNPGTVNKFKISWTTDNILSALVLGGNLVCTNATANAFELVGANVVSRPVVRSSVYGTQRTIHAETTNITLACDWRDILFTHAVDLSAIASGNCGGNSGITFRTADDYFLDFGTANAAITDNCWATSTGGGAGGTGAFPLPQDTIIFDDLSWDDASNTFTFTANHRFGNINASALTEADTLTFGTPITLYGDLLIAPAGTNITFTTTGSTITLDPRLRFEDGADTQDVNVKPSTTTGVFVVGVGLTTTQTGTVKLITNNFTNTGGFTLTSGKLDLGGKTLTCGTSTLSGTNTRELKDSVGGGKIICTGLTGTVFNMATTTNLTVSNAPAIEIGNSASPLTLTGAITVALGALPATFGNLTICDHG